VVNHHVDANVDAAIAAINVAVVVVDAMGSKPTVLLLFLMDRVVL